MLLLESFLGLLGHFDGFDGWEEIQASVLEMTFADRQTQSARNFAAFQKLSRGICGTDLIPGHVWGSALLGYESASSPFHNAVFIRCILDSTCLQILPCRKGSVDVSREK